VSTPDPALDWREYKVAVPTPIGVIVPVMSVHHGDTEDKCMSVAELADDATRDKGVAAEP
jgi:hypothetical protein